MKYFKIEYIKNSKHYFMILKSQNKIEAIKDFREKKMGVFISLKEINEPFSFKIEKLKKFIAKRLKSKKIDQMSYIATLRQIAVMLDAGIPINNTLANTIKTTNNKKIKEIFQEIFQDIESGANFSDSIKRFEDQVGKLSVAMIELGEKTGLLSESIEKLADILQDIYDNRVKLKKATRYPLITIFVMMIAFSIVITMVVPQFASIFNQSGAKLPFPTLLLIAIEKAIEKYGLQMGIGSVLIFIMLSIFYKRSEKFQLIIDRIMLKIYIVGSVIYLSMIGRFILIFDRLTKAGVPIIESLKTAISVVDNSYLRERLKLISNAIGEGKSLTEGFRESKQFEDMIIQMLEAGESSGAINQMLEKISTYYKNKYGDLVDNVSTMIEPILIAGIAGFVLLLALGIFLPMWSMAGAVGG